MDYNDAENFNPYKGLIPYSESKTDNQYFFGREKEQEIVIDNLWASRLTVLYGSSGVGKSSLLRAGVAYRLRQAAKENLNNTGKQRFCVIVFPPLNNDGSSWQDPLEVIKNQLKKEITDLFGNKLLSKIEQQIEQASLIDTLKACIKIISSKNESISGRLFIILDQFEEFDSLEDTKKHKFAEELSQAINNSDLNVHFLISIREDALAKLDYFKGFIFRNLLDNRLEIKHLNRESAKDAIEKPIEEYKKSRQPTKDISIEPELVTAVLNDIKFQKEEERFEAPYLQLIMVRLWKQEMTEKSPSHKLQEQTYTKTLGKAEKIVQKHLDDKLEELRNDENIERESSYRLFNYLVTPSGKKLALNVEDLTRYVQGELNQIEELDEKKIKRWLTKLSEGEARILRPLAAYHYEIFFDILVKAISKQLQHQHKIKEIEQIAKDAWSQFDSSQLDALLQAMQAGQKFQENFGNENLKDYYAPQLKSTLQNILDNIREENQFQAHEKTIYSLSFSPKGNSFATGSEDCTARVWDLKGNLMVQPLKGHSNWIWSVNFSPDGKQLATGSADGTVCLWDVQQGQHRQTFQVCKPSQDHKWVLSVSFSPDGKQLATGSNDGKARLWDLQGNITDTFSVGESSQGDDNWVWSVSFRPKYEQLATGSANGTVRLWDLKSCKEVEKSQFDGRVSGTVYDLSFSPDGNYLAAALSNGTARLWDLKNNPQESKEFIGHQCWVYSVSFRPDGKQLATSSADGTARLWDLEGNQLAILKDHKGFIWSVSFGQNHLATGSTDGTVRLWRSEDSKFKGHTGFVWSVRFSPDGQKLVTCSSDKTAYLWDLHGDFIDKLLLNEKSPILSAGFSPVGSKLAIGSEDGTVYIWDLQNNSQQQFKRHKGWIWSISFSHDGEYFVTTSSEDKKAYLWNLQGEIKEKLGHDNSPVFTASFSPIEHKFATGAADGKVRLWDLKGKKIKEFDEYHKGFIWSLNFSRCGKYLATGSSDCTARLWDLEGKTLKIFEGHQNWVWSVSFRPKYEQLATSSADGTVRLWDLKGQLVQEFKDHKGAVYSVSFSPDGKQLVTTSTNGNVKLLSIEDDLEPILTKGCNWLKDYFVKHPEKKNILKISCDS